MELINIGACTVFLMSLGYFLCPRMSSFSKLKYTPGSIKKMPNFEKLVDKCTKDAKQSAIAAGNWTDDWEAETKMACRRILSTYIVARNIEKKYPEEFEKAASEADD